MKGSGLGAAMAGGNPGSLALIDRDREEDDFYATPPDATEALARRYSHLLLGTTLWEPCAGDGAMVDVLRPYLGAQGHTITTDINPRRADVRRADVFDPRIDAQMTTRKAIRAVVTNPPFMLAQPIIERIMAPGFLPNLTMFALLLKATFWHADSRRELFRKHPPAIIHPLTWRLDFKNLGRPTMECAWHVWLPDPRDPPGPNPHYEPMAHPSKVAA
jgi:hypothetical protein